MFWQAQMEIMKSNDDTIFRKEKAEELVLWSLSLDN